MFEFVLFVRLVIVLQAVLFVRQLAVRTAVHADPDGVQQFLHDVRGHPVFAQAVHHLADCVKAARHYLHRVIRSDGERQKADYFLIDQIIALVTLTFKRNEHIFVFLLLFQADASQVTAILRCLGGNLTAQCESDYNLTPRGCGLHAYALVKVAVTAVLEQRDEPVLVLVESERQLLREHAHRVQCSNLLVQTLKAISCILSEAGKKSVSY